jgi:hypothetical protein
MSAACFDILMLLARPAAGKSETIRYLKNTPLPERLQCFHVGKIDEIDDFPMLWTWFEEDDILSGLGQPRLHSTTDGNFNSTYLWDVLIRRICLEYQKRLRDYPASLEPVTALVEFARGTQHGGWERAFQHVSRLVAERSAILYLDVSWEESLRKNRQRFNPDRPDSILQHGLADEKMEHLYYGSDWQQVSRGAAQGRIPMAGVDVPFVVMENEDDVTTPGGAPLGERLEARLGALWSLYRSQT